MVKQNSTFQGSTCFRAAVSVTGLAFALLSAHAMALDPVSKAGTAGPSTNAGNWGTFDRLFSADSPWNARPVGPKLGDDVIPKSDYFPAIAEGSWSTGVFLAKEDDPPMTIKGLPGKAGVWDPDGETFRTIEIPHWPDATRPASASDGHADIVDPVMGVVHSFWQLKKIGDQWVAAQYAWTPLKGRGWGDPAHYYQGARAAAVPTSGGLIRRGEVDDGDRLYHHALALSLTYNALSPKPTYVFPATAADNDAASTNKGTIPEGTLLMLPPSFDPSALATPAVRKVAETLKVHGAYVVDRNVGTPYVIYVEIASGFNLHRNGWNSTAAVDLERIRSALRPVVSTDGWLDGNGRPFTPNTSLNVVSMRGPWKLVSGPAAGSFDTWKQAVVFPGTETRIVQTNDTGNNLTGVTWARPRAGESFRVRCVATGGAKLHVQFREGSRITGDTGALGDGETATVVWPTSGQFSVTVISGTGPQASSIHGEMVEVKQ